MTRIAKCIDVMITGTIITTARVQYLEISYFLFIMATIANTMAATAIDIPNTA